MLLGKTILLPFRAEEACPANKNAEKLLNGNLSMQSPRPLHPHTDTANFNSHQSLGYPATPGSLFLPQGLLGVVVFTLNPHPGAPEGILRILRGHVVDMGILFTHGLQDTPPW